MNPNSVLAELVFVWFEHSMGQTGERIAMWRSRCAKRGGELIKGV